MIVFEQFVELSEKNQLGLDKRLGLLYYESMKFYFFHQNNSYGVYKSETPSAYNFVVANAASEEEAVNSLLENSNGGYYLDYEYLTDCPCCGTRWSGFPDEESLEGVLELLDYTNLPKNHNLVGIYDCKTKAMYYCTTFEDAATILSELAAESSE